MFTKLYHISTMTLGIKFPTQKHFKATENENETTGLKLAQGILQAHVAKLGSTCFRTSPCNLEHRQRHRKGKIASSSRPTQDVQYLIKKWKAKHLNNCPSQVSQQVSRSVVT